MHGASFHQDPACPAVGIWRGFAELMLGGVRAEEEAELMQGIALQIPAPGPTRLPNEGTKPSLEGSNRQRPRRAEPLLAGAQQGLCWPRKASDAH